MKDEIRRFLEENADEANAKFEEKLISTKYKILGLKTKKLEDFAKNLAKNYQKIEKLDILYHEEVMVYGFMIAYAKLSNAEKIQEMQKLLPFVDNWGTCDSIIPRLRNLERERSFFERLLQHNNPFYVRVGIIWLKRFILKNDLKNIIKMLNNVKNDHYYVKMALAWTYQEAFNYDYEYMFDFVKTIDDEFIKNKTISKCCDSFRLTAEQKQDLRALRKNS